MGEYVYYQRSTEVRGLWRMRVKGTEEELVLDRVPADSWQRWQVTEDGIYFVELVNKSHVIEFYSFATRR